MINAIDFGPNLDDISSNECLNAMCPDPGNLAIDSPITSEFVAAKRRRIKKSRELIITKDEENIGNLMIHQMEHRLIQGNIVNNQPPFNLINQQLTDLQIQMTAFQQGQAAMQASIQQQAAIQEAMQASIQQQAAIQEVMQASIQQQATTQAVMQEAIQQQAATLQQLREISKSVIRSSNSSILVGQHLISPLRNANGILPQDHIPPQWFPATRDDLDSAPENNLTSLIRFYGLDIQAFPPIRRTETIGSKRLRLLKSHLGIR